MDRLIGPLIHAIALVVGLVAGFFIVFNSIFSDVSDVSEYIFSFVLVIAVYGIASLILGFFAASWTVGITLATPAVLLVVWYTVREPGNLGLHLAFIAVTVASACLGAHAGARVRVGPGIRD